MSKKCDKDLRIRVYPKSKKALAELRQRLNLTGSISALANDAIREGIKVLQEKLC